MKRRFKLLFLKSFAISAGLTAGFLSVSLFGSRTSICPGRSKTETTKTPEESASQIVLC